MLTILQGILITVMLLLLASIGGWLGQQAIVQTLSFLVIPVLIFFLVILLFTKPDED